MTRDQAISLLKAHEAELKKLGVTHLFLFGSTARDEARFDSDVDLFFDHCKGTIGLFELMDLQERVLWKAVKDDLPQLERVCRRELAIALECEKDA